MLEINTQCIIQRVVTQSAVNKNMSQKQKLETVTTARALSDVDTLGLEFKLYVPSTLVSFPLFRNMTRLWLSNPQRRI